MVLVVMEDCCLFEMERNWTMGWPWGRPVVAMGAVDKQDPMIRLTSSEVRLMTFSTIADYNACSCT